MPKVSTETIAMDTHVKGGLKIKFDVNVTASGEFTATLSQADVTILQSYNVKLGTAGRRGSREGFFSSSTKAGLIQQVRELMSLAATREVVDSKIVLKYGVKTTCGYVMDLSGNFYPNGNYTKDFGATGWSGGTEYTHSGTSNPFGVCVFARPYRCIVYKYGDGSLKEEIIHMHVGDTDPGIGEAGQWLIDMPGVGGNDLKIHTIPYTEAAAAFFVRFFKVIFKFNEGVKAFVEPEALQIALESGIVNQLLLQ